MSFTAWRDKERGSFWPKKSERCGCLEETVWDCGGQGENRQWAMNRNDLAPSLKGWLEFLKVGNEFDVLLIGFWDSNFFFSLWDLIFLTKLWSSETHTFQTHWFYFHPTKWALEKRKVSISLKFVRLPHFERSIPLQSLKHQTLALPKR